MSPTRPYLKSWSELVVLSEDVVGNLKDLPGYQRYAEAFSSSPIKMLSDERSKSPLPVQLEVRSVLATTTEILHSAHPSPDGLYPLKLCVKLCVSFFKVLLAGISHRESLPRR